MVPQKSRDQAAPGRGSVTVTPATKGAPTKVEIKPDPNELMSLYAVFHANVGFNDPICVHHFLATGVAAANLLANHDDLRKVTTSEDDDPCASGSNNKGGDQ
jgi:hypothetical protein